jgi:hypothetical protein
MGMQKERVRSGLAFHSKAPIEVHSDCEARLDIPVPATKKKSAVTKVMALFLFYLALILFLALTLFLALGMNPFKVSLYSDKLYF